MALESRGLDALDGACNVQVELLSPSCCQSAVERFAHERMTEQVLVALVAEQRGPKCLVNCVKQRRRLELQHFAEHAEGQRLADDRGRLQEPVRITTQPRQASAD